MSKKADSHVEEKAPFTPMVFRSPVDRIVRAREGIEPAFVVSLGSTLGYNKSKILRVLDIPVANFNRKVNGHDRLDAADSERVLAVQDLVVQVRDMVQRSGNPEGFDAGTWLGHWLDKPNAALGGVPPADYLDTTLGAQMVSDVLGKMETGVYS